MQIIKDFKNLFPKYSYRAIEFKRNPDTACYYAGDSLRIDGIIVKATYNTDKYGNNIIYSVPTQYLVFDKAVFDHAEDNRIVSIYYMGCTDTFPIKIFDLSLIFLQNEADPVKNTYIPYERIDLDDLIVLGIQGDSIKVQLNPDKYEYSIIMLQLSKIKDSIATGLRNQHFRVKE